MYWTIPLCTTFLGFALALVLPQNDCCHNLPARAAETAVVDESSSGSNNGQVRVQEQPAALSSVGPARVAGTGGKKPASQCRRVVAYLEQFLRNCE